jgi:glycosyltransferase involved in cell wall biosynthesis
MSNQLPLNTIVIPVYNGGVLLKQAIYSALNQSYPNIEVLVVNDGSTDQDTKKILNHFDEKIQIIHKKNGGTASALNVGFESAKGEFIHWLSHDDVFFPGKVAADMHQILGSKEPSRSISLSGWHFMDLNRQILSTRDIVSEISPALLRNPYWLLLLSMANGCTVCIPKPLFQASGYFREDLRTTQDYDYWLRLFPTCNIFISQEIHVANRIHSRQGSNMIKEHNVEADELFVRIIDAAFDRTASSLDVPRINALCRIREHLAESNYLQSKKLIEEMIAIEELQLNKIFLDKRSRAIFYQMIQSENQGVLT